MPEFNAGGSLPDPDSPAEQMKELLAHPERLQESAEELARGITTWTETDRPEWWVRYASELSQSDKFEEYDSPIERLMAHMAAMATADSLVPLISAGAHTLADKEQGITPTMMGAGGAIVTAYVNSTGPLFTRFVSEVLNFARDAASIGDSAEDMLKDLAEGESE
jgi:roadblock/LC7 domain-containing protein